MKEFICFDIGGTAVKYGRLTEDGGILHQSRVPNPVRSGGTEALLQLLREIVRSEREGAAGIAVSTAGVVDYKKGVIVFAGETFPGFTGTPLAEILSKASGLPVRVENDVNCAALGEYWLGAGCGAEPFVMLTVGTGVGGAVITEGKLLHGASFAAGEVGYMYQPGGMLEDLSSVTALLRYGREEGLSEEQSADGETVINLAKAGNVSARRAVQRMLYHLAVGIAQIACLINPERVVIGGGITAASDYLWPLLLEELAKQLPPHLTDLAVVPARLGNSAGMVGALASFL